QTPTLIFLGHSDNITFRVDDRATDEQFLLRLHRPRTHTLLGLRQQPLAIQSELQWLEALSQETTILVPQPIRNRDRELVTLLALRESELLPCTLLRWMVGDPFPVEGVATEPASALGQLLAALHDHASTWKTPPDFVRPSYDTAFLHQVATNLQLGA